MNQTCLVPGHTFNKRIHAQLNTSFSANLRWPTVMWTMGVGAVARLLITILFFSMWFSEYTILLPDLS